MASRLKFCDEERHLLDCIHAAPRDDSAYLSYADWLEGRDGALAEFIRLGVEHSKLDRSALRWGVKFDRKWELERLNGARWARPMSRGFDLLRYDRGLPVVLANFFFGFPENFLVKADSWLRHMSPRHLVILHMEGREERGLAEMLHHPFMRRVHFLMIHGATDRFAQILAESDVPERVFNAAIAIHSTEGLSDEAWEILSRRFGANIRYRFSQLHPEVGSFDQPPSTLPRNLREYGRHFPHAEVDEI